MKTKKAYKIFRTLKSRPGEIFPLFIGKTIATPIGEWIKAEYIPTKGFAERPGWHTSTLPSAPHLLKKDGTMDSSRVWAEVEISDDVNWQSVADKSSTKDIKGMVPVGGHYSFKRPKHQGVEWMISGEIKIVKILTDSDIENILKIF